MTQTALVAPRPRSVRPCRPRGSSPVLLGERREGSSRKAAPDGCTRGVVSLRRACSRGRQRSRWALLLALGAGGFGGGGVRRREVGALAQGVRERPRPENHAELLGVLDGAVLGAVG